MRVSPAITRADSILQTASIAWCVSVAVTATDHTMFSSSAQLLLRNFNMLAIACAALLRLVSIVELAQFALALAYNLQKLPDQFDRLRLRVRLQNRESTYQFLGLDEWTIGHAKLAA
jgi:hypothetical protein